MVSAVAWQKFLVSNHKEAATLQLAKDKMWYLDEKLIEAFSDAGGTVFAASVKKADGCEGSFAEILAILHPKPKP